MIIPGKIAKKFVSEYVKVNPAGIDVKPKKVFKIKDFDYIYLHGNKRGFIINDKFVELRENLEEIKPIDDYWVLDEGLYYVVFPEVVIPPYMVALALPRSSLNRLGIQKYETALFDPGYKGEFTQTFYFPKKAKIHINEAWIQLIFIQMLMPAEELYNGYWNNERY
ncbi:NEQ329 [Nanoarchaeum equitans Kin4-M]|uniref:NEQ329 n=1 Tax=Nanoarchaeum equitans (strain Kin4-M) TaxID=228908 RepID=Q74NJ1_NANEQ|nr:NEQ329 [Nanoarchaeum equitans Kin4-M]